MNHLPSNTYTIGDYVVRRTYNRHCDVFGGKPYVDIIVSPYFMADMEDLPKKDRREIEEFMKTAPTTYL